MDSQIRRVRILAFIEGISLLLLLLVAMPLKYQYGNNYSVPVMGWIHGLLWIVFLFTASSVSQKRAWSDGFLILLILSSVVPFGMVLMDRKLKHK